MITFRLQVYYCCWEELMVETTKSYKNKEVELDFFGNSRHHHEDCPVWLEILRRREDIKRLRDGESKSTLDIAKAATTFEI